MAFVRDVIVTTKTSARWPLSKARIGRAYASVGEVSFSRNRRWARHFAAIFLFGCLASPTLPLAWSAGALDGSSAGYTDFEQKLISMPAGSWWEVPDSKMLDVCAPTSFGVSGTMGCAGIVEAWGGGAYGSRQRKMFIWGGGHNDYWGNEVYAFDLRHGKWARLTDPTPGPMVSASGSDPLPDGSPNSRHTYDGFQYIEHMDRLFAQGGSVSPGGGATSVSWLFDPKVGKWTNLGAGADRPGGYGIASAYHAKTRSVFARTTKALWRYEFDTGQWQRLVDFGYKPLWPRYEVSGNKRAAIDTRRDLFWCVGNNDYLVWDVSNGKIVTNQWTTSGGGVYSNASRLGSYPEQVFQSGGGEIHDMPAPGFDYDSQADEFVAWSGGAPHRLDLASRVWGRGSADGAPPRQVQKGTYGRWRYVPDYNVFILINGVSSNVFFYKNTAGARCANPPGCSHSVAD